MTQTTTRQWSAPTIESTIRRFQWLAGSRGPLHLVDLGTFRSLCGSSTAFWSRSRRQASCQACVASEGRLTVAAGSHQAPEEAR
jgi:hypothetical protein